MTYEETALAGKLSDDQLDALLAAFVNNSDPRDIARKIDVPLDLVLKALEDTTLVERAFKAKRTALTIRFLGVAMDRLQAIIESPLAKDPARALAAIKVQRDLLGLRRTERAERLDEPKPTRRRRTKAEMAEAKPEPPPQRKQLGALEQALLDMDDDE